MACYAFYQRYVGSVYHEAHAFLAFVAYYFFVGESGVAYWKCVDVDDAACRFNKLREGIEVAACAVVVD